MQKTEPAPDLNRYEQARNYVYSHYARLYNPALMEAAFTHTSSVDNFVTLLALSRSLPVELAKIAALFHDFARYMDNCPSKDHARLSSLHAHHYLSETGMFETSEIDDISYAIANHSRKERQDDPLSEALKDADLMARFAENLELPESASNRKRLMEAAEDLN